MSVSLPEVLDYYIGYDPREDRAANVCRKSAVRRSSKALHTVYLKERPLRYVGLYDRPWRVVNGQKIDERDGKCFSTDFSFTRFLVPALMQYEGWALFTDCDFLWADDPAKLFAERDDKYACLVVKHNHDPQEQHKMDGVVQTRYHRKNWSSLVLWNCGHPSNKFLTVDAVNQEPGQWLHAFGWLKDEEIGSLDPGWNFLVDVNNPDEVKPRALHYTLGGPWFEKYEDCAYADLWAREEKLGDKPLPLHLRGINAA